MQRKCLKCGHTNETATGSELEACPACGAIYSRVEAAVMARRTQAPAPVPAPAPRTSGPNALTGKGRDGDYLEQLREDSNYPTFRSVIGFFTVVGYVLAALLAIGAVVTIVKGSFAAGCGMLAFALFLFIATRMGKEVSLMMADGCDALVRLAARRELG